MMRQWKPVKQTMAAARMGMEKVLRSALGTAAVAALVVSAGMNVAAAQGTPIQTRTALAVSTERTGAATETVFTAHVTDSTGNDLNTGVVTFDTAAGSLGSAAVDGSGDATLSVTSLPEGTSGTGLGVTAVYHPAAASETETGAPATVTASSASAQAVVKPEAAGVPDFTLTADPSSVTVAQGQYGTMVLTIAPVNGFAEQVSLSCSNLPAQATCSFSPVTGNTTSGAFTSTLQLQTQAASGALAAPDFGLGRGAHSTLAWMLPGVLALAGLASLRRKAFRGVGHTRMMGLALLLVAGSLGLSACNPRYGYEHHPPQVATGTLPGTYTINVSAAGNNGSAVTSHNINVTLIVQ
jgi:hypothetical protein